MYESFRVPDVPHSDLNVAFYNVSRPRPYTRKQEALCVAITTEQHTISMSAAWELFADWFSRIGLRFRIKMRLFRRIIADARQRRAASYSVS